jgi:hypothetical protein
MDSMQKRERSKDLNRVGPGRPSKASRALTAPVDRLALMAESLSEGDHYGYIYVIIKSGDDDKKRFDGKIGFSTHPKSRCSNMSTGTTGTLTVHYQSFTALPWVRGVERHLHTLFQSQHIRREWYRLSLDDIEVIDRYTEVAMYRERMLQDFQEIQLLTLAPARREEILDSIRQMYAWSEDPQFTMSEDQVLYAFSRHVQEFL